MFNLTQDERRAMVFLTVLALAGTVMHLYFKKSAAKAKFTRIQSKLATVDLNAADKALLDSVPGIGEKTAQRIIDYRQEKRFEDLEELRRVEGVTEYRFNKMKEFLRVQ